MMTHLVFIIFKNAPTELRRVTICALPVVASVTVITGQENARNASNDSKRCPQERSYLANNNALLRRLATDSEVLDAPGDVVHLKIPQICGVHLTNVRK